MTMLPQLRSQELLVTLFTFMYVCAFGAYYLFQGDAEFLWYIAVLVFFFGLVFATIRKTEFPLAILWGLSLWGLLHMAGGGISVGETVLYGTPLIPLAGSGELFVLKYDQFVHAFGFMVATLVMWHVIKPHVTIKASPVLVYTLVALAGMGLGVVNEIVEFIAVLTVPETGVGGYANTALDLVFNTLGALIAIGIIHAQNTRNAHVHIR